MLIAYALNTCLPQHACPTTLLLWSTYRPSITGYNNSKKQQTATLNCHVNAIYVPETNVPLSLYICQSVHVHISDYCGCIYPSNELLSIHNVTTSTGTNTLT